MLAFTSVLVALVYSTTILANLINVEKRYITHGLPTPTRNGTHDGFYYYFWTDGQGSVNYTNKAGGQYTVTWSNTGNFFGGKGWSPGSGRNVTYSGSWDGAQGNSYVSLYGWMQNPLIEYYIVESFGTYDPGSAFSAPKETITVDGGTYNIYITRRTIAGGEGPGHWTVLTQLWSVRQQKRVGGTINAQAHLDAWARAGVKLGNTHTFQILATEAYFYKNIGTASITVQGP
ncbi:glycoside hydrolase [Westerdykella ornata]|uniref:Endo-1,4-beta-xylanase n=1 Tax=Westerdykella ornata TaxID=318751 RepID=A0A6A6J572_WESOR|nr:glycoside hydrolase [Westerdykella ornata]KAF2271595.1 glycoside hydrolase [Westerdykella ornata]